MATSRRATRRPAARPAKRTAASAGARISVAVGRFGSAPVNVEVSKSATVAGVLEAAGYEVSGRERAWLNGSRTTPETRVKAGDIVSVVSPKQAGSL